MSEEVLVIQRAELERSLGITQEENTQKNGGFLKLSDGWSIFPKIQSEFRLRDSVEEDTSLVQLIPYVMVFNAVEGKTLVYTRENSEKRLTGKLSVGFGGHINPIDEGATKKDPRISFDEGLMPDTYNSALLRELDEELYLPESTSLLTGPLGLVFQDSSPVDRVHLGVFHILVTLEKPLSREAHSEYISKADLFNILTRFENWSQTVIKQHWSSNYE